MLPPSHYALDPEHPANKIPIHFFCLPITQWEILLVNVLTDPILYERIITSALYHNDPIFLQAITLFHNYVLIRQMFAHLTIPCVMLGPGRDERRLES